jgi:hypothetical protein
MSPAPTVSPIIETDVDFKKYTWRAYQIAVPIEYRYSIFENAISFSKNAHYGAGRVQNMTSVSITETSLGSDPCIKKPEGYPNAYCTVINGYNALDWGTDKLPDKMGPPIGI